MKLLIVDDEELTRNGLVSTIPWKSIGISEIYQADDGVNGLSAALKYKPEIILCDVRMPRMDGIQMVENLQDTLPGSVVIFMSGYSDKEYLKAAIKLKAVNYVEKPLNPEEIREAVEEGIKRYKQNQKSIRGETWQILETTSMLAMQLTLQYEKNKNDIDRLCELLSFKKIASAYFTTFIIKRAQPEPASPGSASTIAMELNAFLRSYPLSSLMIEKHQNHLIFHIFGDTSHTSIVLDEIGEYLKNHTKLYGKCFVCRGQTVIGISKAYQSYESAVVLMQSCFFFPLDTVLIPELLTANQIDLDFSFLSRDFGSELLELLLAKNKKGTDVFLDELHYFFSNNTAILPDQAKDIYYKLFTELRSLRKQMKMQNDYLTEYGHETIISYLEQFFSYGDLHNALIEKVDIYYSDLENKNEENSTIFLIKEYISKNYQYESLSVKDISEHVYLSTSYVCTLFKSETGQTLNQYITEYRMKKAKKLLQDPRYKITDISSRVGYSDGNYFGKSFKKSEGLSPSEYREKMIK